MEQVYTEWLYEQDGSPYYYVHNLCSERIPLRYAFPILNSAVNYIQDHDYCYAKIRVTLVERF